MFNSQIFINVSGCLAVLGFEILKYETVLFLGQYWLSVIKIINNNKLIKNCDWVKNVGG